MKRIHPLSIAFTFAGCFLGAGFVSGQELGQFFASFGKEGLYGLAIMLILLPAFGTLLLRLVAISDIGECDALVVRSRNRFFMAFIGFAENLFLFGVAVIMTAGAGALFTQLFSFPAWIAAALFSLLLFLFLLGGVERMVALFSVTVPILVVVMAAVCGICLFRYGFPDYSVVPAHEGKNPLLQSFLFSALSFVAYNAFLSVSILTPVGRMVRSRKTVYIGILTGTALLAVIAFGIISVLLLFPDALSDELPMLTVAANLSPILGYVCAALLLLGMLGTGVSSLVAMQNYVRLRLKKSERFNKVLSAVLCLLCFAGSLFGFGDLIGTIYPISGYLGMIALVCIAEHYFHLVRKKKKEAPKKKSF